MDPTALPIRDLHLPEATGLWPLAPGWWFVIAVVTVLFAIWIRQVWLAWREGALRRHAIRQLDSRFAAYRKEGDAIAFANDVSELLRRTMLAYAPRDEVAGLTGQAWLDWLNEDLPTPQFTGDAARALVELPYVSSETSLSGMDVEPLVEAVRARLRAPVGGSR